MNTERLNCTEHSGVCERVKSVEKNIDDIWKTINATRNWVMAGMGGLIVQAVVFIVSMLK